MFDLTDPHRWAQIGIAVQLTFKYVSGLVIEANFFSQIANPLE